MRRKVKKKSFFDKFSYSTRNTNIFLVVVFLFLLSGLTVGYAVLNNVLSIKGDVAIRPFKDIRITSVTGPEMTNGAYENYNFKYSHDLLVVNGVLPSTNSTLTYTITITNNGNIDMDLIDIINETNNSNISYQLSGINLGDTIKAKESVTITVTLKTSKGSNSSFNSQLQFIFEESYVDITAPVITFNPVADNVWYTDKDNYKYKVNVTATDDIAVTSLKYCQTTNTSCTPTIVVANNSSVDLEISESSGTNTICVLASDSSKYGPNSVTVCSNKDGKYYKLDKEDPTINPKLSGTLGNNGWYKSNVVISPNGSDITSKYKGHKYQTSTNNGASYNTLSDYTTSNITVSNECVDNKVKIIGYDNALRFSNTYTSNTIKIDKTAPVITVDGHTSDYSVDYEISLSGNYVIPTGSSNDNCNGNISVTTSGSVNTKVPGSYPITYTSTDQAGNSKTLTLTVNVKDVTKPSITFNPMPTDSWSKSDYTVNVKATDDVEVKSFMYCQTTTTSCTPNITITNNSNVDLTISTSSATNTICAQATDSTSNITTICSNKDGKYYKLDKLAPTINPTLGGTLGSNGWYKSNVTINVNGSDTLSQYMGHKYQTSTNNGASYGAESGYVSNNITVSNECVDNKIKITGYDNALNNSSTYTSNTIKIDKTAPVITVDGHTTNYSVDYEILPFNKKFENGTLVYYNPVTGSVCSQSEYVASNSLNQNKTGCMKWYIFNDETNNMSVDMILDHNVTSNVAWISKDDYNSLNIEGANCPYDSCNNKGPVTALAKLKADTASWSSKLTRSDNYIDPLKKYKIDYTGYKARLIEANEVADIVGATEALKWNSGLPYGTIVGSNSDWIYFDGSGSTYDGWKTKVVDSTNKSKYAWLYDYTEGCINSGCNIEETGTYGYWTSSASSYGPANTWAVEYGNGFSRAFVYAGKGQDNTDLNLGVRPVITINKSELTEKLVYNIPTGTSNDNCNGNLSVTTTGSVNPKVPGSYPVNYTSTDNAGNSKTLTLTVNVKDTKAPTIKYTTKGTVVNNISNAPFTLSLNVSDSDSENNKVSYLYCVSTNGSNCTPNIVGTNLTHGEYFDQNGQYKMCALATDSAGNSSGVVCSENYTASFEIWEKYDSKTMYLWEKYNLNTTYSQGSEYGSTVNTTNYAVSTSSTAYTAGNGSCASSDIYYGSSSSSTFGYWTNYACKGTNYSWQFSRSVHDCLQYPTYAIYSSCSCNSSTGTVTAGSTTVYKLENFAVGFITNCSDSDKIKTQIISSAGNPNTCWTAAAKKSYEDYKCLPGSYTKNGTLSSGYGTYSAHTNASSCTSTSSIWTRTTAYSWKKYHCNASYSKGTTMYNDVKGETTDAYPTNGKSGDYWYVKKNDTTYEKGDTLISEKVYAAPGTYPGNGRHSDGYWYVKKEKTCTPTDGKMSYAYGKEYTCDPGDGVKRTFYVLEENDDTVSLIMDRNIGGLIPWTSKADYLAAGGTEAEYGTYGNNNKGPITVTNYLNKVTSNWKDVAVSLPTGWQIATAGNDKKWLETTQSSTILSSWLYENTDCQVNTCTEEVPNDMAGKGMTDGYWTSSRYVGIGAYAGDYTLAWNSGKAKYLSGGKVYWDDSDSTSTARGARPVITIPKTNFYNESKTPYEICSTTADTVSYAPGTPYTCDPGDATPRTFYVLGENADGSISLILDRNIDGTVQWISKEDYLYVGGTETDYATNGKSTKGPITARKYLNDTTRNWKNVITSFPTGDQIAKAGGDTEWNGYYTGKILPNWLYVNSGTYWTSTPVTSVSTAVYMSLNGYLDNNYVKTSYGVRPVITIPKSSLTGTKKYQVTGTCGTGRCGKVTSGSYSTGASVSLDTYSKTGFESDGTLQNCTFKNTSTGSTVAITHEITNTRLPSPGGWEIEYKVNFIMPAYDVTVTCNYN